MPLTPVIKEVAQELMHSHMRKVAGGTMLVGAVLLAWPAVAEFVAVDACLDSGGSYNYELGACDPEHSHPGPSNSSAISLGASLVVGLAGVALLVTTQPRDGEVPFIR